MADINSPLNNSPQDPIGKEPTREFFGESYHSVPPWDIGKPQPAFVQLAAQGKVKGSVLDVGCGTGENALYFAANGREVWGVDLVELAIEQARTKAKLRGVQVKFLVMDVLKMALLNQKFDNIIDSGLFHVFSDADRALFVRNMRHSLKAGGLYHILCFSEFETGAIGPRRIKRAEFAATFGSGWSIQSVDETRFQTNMHPDGARAWIATIEKLRT